MKINEKPLCAYATSPTLVDKEGYLIKRGEGNKGFQRRWFVLKGNLLFYFEKRGDKEPIGVIILEGCSVELDEMDAQFCFRIVFHGGGNRSYVLCAENQESMEQWMKCLACASYDYMKLMVTELKRQLNQLGENTSSNCCKHGGSYVTNGKLNNNNNYDSLASESPLPPPRNKHHTSSLVASSNKQITAKSANSVSSSRIKISFKELHTSYGRQISRDHNEWLNRLNAEQTLICL